MRYVGKKHTQTIYLLTLFVLGTFSAVSAAKINFFQVATPHQRTGADTGSNLGSGNQTDSGKTTTGGSQTIGQTLPPPVSGPMQQAINGQALTGDVKFTNLASTPPVVAAAAEKISGLNMKAPGLGGLAMQTAAAAR